MTPYVLPFILYLAASQVCVVYPQDYAWLYPALMLLVAAVTAALLYRRGLFQPHWRLVPAVVVGVIGIVLWVALCRLEWDQVIAGYLPSWLRSAPRTGFDPFTAIGDAPARWAFIAARLAGLALLVPVVEELFWRGFLARWLIAPDWHKQPMGRFTPFSFAGVTLLFTLAHPEWLAAAVYCACSTCS